MPFPNTIPSGATVTSGGGSALLVPSTVQTFDNGIVNGVWAPVPTNYYPMNETSGTVVVDAMGNNNGTYSGSPLLAQRQTDCLDGKTVPYFGGSSYATLHDGTASGTAFTRMIIFQSGTLLSASEGGTIVGNYPNSGSVDYNVYLPQNTYNLNISINLLTPSSFAVVPPGSWYVLFMVFDGTYYYTYLNGALLEKLSATYTKCSNWYVAGDARGGSWVGFAGKYCQWDATALNQTQVANITNSFFGSQVTAIVNPTVNSTATWLAAVKVTGLATHAWPLNEANGTTVADYVGSDAGTVYGTIQQYANPLGHQTGMYFDGSTNYVLLPGIELPSSGPFSLECYALVGQITNAEIVSTYDGSNGGASFNLVIQSLTNFGMYAWTNGSAQTAQGPPMSGAVPVHLVMTFDGTYVRLYMNGAFTGASAATSYTGGASAMKIGKRSYGAGYYTNGTIANVATYSGVLTPAQVFSLFQSL